VSNSVSEYLRRYITFAIVQGKVQFWYFTFCLLVVIYTMVYTAECHQHTVKDRFRNRKWRWRSVTRTDTRMIVRSAIWLYKTIFSPWIILSFWMVAWKIVIWNSGISCYALIVQWVPVVNNSVREKVLLNCCGKSSFNKF